MKNKLLIFIILLIVVTLYSCSKTKYKGFRQYKTNFISYYNTYFNIKQRYKIGKREAIYAKQENTTDIISVFEFENDPQYFEPIAQFKETSPKVSKLLLLRPNNKWMDDAILIEGKIRYLKGDLDSALQLLTYLVDYYPKGYAAGHLPGGKLKGYEEKLREAVRKNKPIHQSKLQYKFARNEGLIWLIKTLIKKKQYERAQSLILNTDGDMGFPDIYRNDLKKTQIMLNIETKNNTKAIENLLDLLEDKKINKKDRSRMNFILAQLYEKEKNLASAKNYFERALEGKLSEDLEFEAKLRSLSYTQSSPDESLGKLKKMLNKGKYAQNMDKIHFAMGNIYSDKGDMDNALKEYQLAISLSKNPTQKFTIYEKIASLFYQKSNYLISAKYYDSALQVMPANYGNKKEFTKKVEALKKLLIEYNKFITNDSILELAALGPEKAKQVIEKSIRKEYEAEKSKELAENTQLLIGESVKNNATVTIWYFSNQEGIAKGKVNFQKKWGKIQLIDNWKKISATNESANSSGKINGNENGQIEESSIDIVAEVEASKLPFSAEAKKPLISEIQKSLIAMARIYQYEILDLSKAIETYELLLKKYPVGISAEDEILYSLYRLYLEKDQIKEAEEIKDKLIKKYPSSKYSLYATNPNAKTDDEKSDFIVAKKYKEAYKQYRLANYNESLNQCNLIESEHPKHSLIPKVKLLKAFIYSYSNQTQIYISTLTEIVEKYASTEEGKTAQEFLDLINKLQKDGSSTSKEKEINTESKIDEDILSVKKVYKNDVAISSDQKLESIKQTDPVKSEEKPIPNSPIKGEDLINYTFNPNSTHYILFHITGNMKSSSAKNLGEVFLKSSGQSSKVSADNLDIESNKFVSFGKFTKYETATNFYTKNKNEVLLQSIIKNSKVFYISAENLDILYISSGWKEYLDFFDKNYK